MPLPSGVSATELIESVVSPCVTTNAPAIGRLAPSSGPSKTKSMVGVYFFAVMLAIAGAVVSSVKVRLAEVVLPAVSVSVTTTVWLPSALGAV